MSLRTELLSVGSQTCHLDPVALVIQASGDINRILRLVFVSPLVMIPSPIRVMHKNHLLSAASFTTFYKFVVKKFIQLTAIVTFKVCPMQVLVTALLVHTKYCYLVS